MTLWHGVTLARSDIFARNYFKFLQIYIISNFLRIINLTKKKKVKTSCNTFENIVLKKITNKVFIYVVLA